MPTITLPDQSQRNYPEPISIAAIAADIGAGLAKAALASEVDGRLVDLSTVISSDVKLRIITARDPEGLEVIRHSCAHLLAQAVKQLFPQAQVTIGPVIENGFYYDFAFERSFTPEDLTAIEARMHEIAKREISIERFILPRDEAIEFFKAQGELYKAQIIAAIPDGEILSLYRQDDFVDLCRGPHVPNTRHLHVFKLMSVAGAYWRGDSSNEMLQRIYGTAWHDAKAQAAYLHMLEEAEKRDHRKIGKQMELFHLQEEAPGMPFWHANGWTIYKELEQYIRSVLVSRGYIEVKTPQMLDNSLWERSGHSAKFSQHMFTTESENRMYAIKPMNCPAHIQIYNVGMKSYRDLPIRIAEFGSCFRNEPSGALHGLMRCRNFVQDDAHIFCTLEQVSSEIANFLDLLQEVYAVFGFYDITVKLATRPDQRVGDDAVWDQAEAALADVLNAKGWQWSTNPGEGAFYGPKIEFQLKDCLGRVWQCGTVQLDFNMPERLAATYIGEDSAKHTPIMIHRAILGSLERFIAILTENFAGHFPLWLAPQQVVIMTITDRQAAFAQEIMVSLQSYGLRVTADLRNEKIGYKIREHTINRVPYLVVLGDQEVAARELRVRLRDGTDLGLMSMEHFQARLLQEIRTKQLPNEPKQVEVGV